MMFLRFWGVRGSTPTPQRENLRYGGNTSCLELRTGDGLFILDCGTGLRLLGRAMVRGWRRKRIRANVFLSHYHWDHIQGLPFFLPLYHEANSFVFHSFRSIDTSVQQALEDQMINPYFPVDMAAMRARREFREIGEERMNFDGMAITTRWLNHPQGCLGFRIEHRGKVIVYATDNEPGEVRGDRNVRLLAEGADMLIYDAQYTPEEYRTVKKNWGHSTWEEGVRIAKETGVKKLILFHHDPDHNDRQVDAILRSARRQFRATHAAREGMSIRVG
jgi:phosphoribosyl 1,2-cyclic phosphodiesterase